VTTSCDSFSFKFKVVMNQLPWVFQSIKYHYLSGSYSTCCDILANSPTMPASTCKNYALIEKTKRLQETNNVSGPWDSEFEKMISGMKCLPFLLQSSFSSLLFIILANTTQFQSLCLFLNACPQTTHSLPHILLQRLLYAQV